MKLYKNGTYIKDLDFYCLETVCEYAGQNISIARWIEYFEVSIASVIRINKKTKRLFPFHNVREKLPKDFSDYYVKVKATGTKYMIPSNPNPTGGELFQSYLNIYYKQAPLVYFWPVEESIFIANFAEKQILCILQNDKSLEEIERKSLYFFDNVKRKLNND